MFKTVPSEPQHNLKSVQTCLETFQKVFRVSTRSKQVSRMSQTVAKRFQTRCKQAQNKFQASLEMFRKMSGSCQTVSKLVPDIYQKVWNCFKQLQYMVKQSFKNVSKRFNTVSNTSH